MWATANESRKQIVGLYHRAWAHSQAAIDTLALDAIGYVPCVVADDRSEVTLHQILVHRIAETNRHAGHADIIRELIDEAVRLREDNHNMAPDHQAWWKTTAAGWPRRRSAFSSADVQMSTEHSPTGSQIALRDLIWCGGATEAQISES